MELHVKLIHKLCSCQQCGSKFENKISCSRHITNQHGSSKNLKTKRPRKYFCHLCVKEYENRRQLEDHVRSYHEKERNAECTICQKSELTTESSNLILVEMNIYEFKLTQIPNRILLSRHKETYGACSWRKEYIM